MRVCHVISGIDIDNGGPPVALGGLAAAQVRAGMQVSVLSSWRFQQSHDVAADWRTKGINVRLIGPAKEPMSRHPDLFPAAEEMARTHDVFHIHSMWESIQHQACRAAQRAGTPYVYRPSGMLDPWNMTKGTLRKKLYLALRARANLNGAAALHFTSRIERDWVARLNLKAPAIVEPLGMNFAEYETLPAAGSFRARHSQLSGRKIVLFLGRIHAGKGLELLIPAMARLKDGDAALVIAGPDGNFRAGANELIAQNGLSDRVVFTGLVSGGDKIAALADADVLALPSYHENFGLVVVEALAAGTPVVVSDQVGLHPDVVEAGVGAAVPLDAEKLARELDRWLGDDGMRQTAGAKGREWVRTRFNWDTIAHRWGEHYERIVRQRGRRSSAPSSTGALRIAHFIPALDARTGGVAAAVVGLAPAQARAGLDVTVFSTWSAGEHSETPEEFAEAGVKLELVGPARGKFRRHRDLRRRTREAVAQADVVHVHALWEYLQHYAATAAQELGKPYIFSPHGMLDPWSLAQNALVKRVYLALRLRGDLHRASTLHYTAEIERELVAPLGLRPRGIVIPNGLRLDEFAELPAPGTFRRRYPQVGNRPIAMFMSRVHYKKGLDLLIPAFARARLAPESMLVIAGPPSDDAYLAEVKAMVRQNGLEDRTILTGMLRGRERVEALRDADLFILPSRQENFGIVVIEALAAGCPVVISDQVNIHREIAEAQVGGVVPLDADRLAAEIGRWMTDDAIRQQAKARAREFVWRNYDWNAIAQEWVKLYASLAGAAATSPQAKDALRREPPPEAAAVAAAAARVEQDTV